MTTKFDRKFGGKLKDQIVQARACAKTAHEFARKEAIAQLLELSSMIAENTNEFTGNGSTNWGYVGSLGRVNELLAEALGKETQS